MNNKTLLIIVIIILIGGYFLVTRDNETDEDTTPEASRYTVTINNISDSQPLAPGAYIVHTRDYSLNYAGRQTPAAFEPMAEIGDPTDLLAFLGEQEGVETVYTVDAPILPGESTDFEIEATGDNLYFSGVQMAVASNDGFALVDELLLTDEAQTIEAINYDNGTEENAELGSGFDGGQPDPERGAENVDNGTPTDPQDVVKVHGQLTDPILEITVTPVGNE